MLIFLFFYNIIAIPLLYFVFFIGSLFNKKMKMGLKSRWKWYAKLKKQRAQIPANAQVVLFHNSSVGEWEQSAPIIDELRKKQPNLYVIATFFSPSGYNIVKNSNIDHKIYLPFDSLWNAILFFSIIKPKLWVIAKYDVWPNFLWIARCHKIPVVLASAELAADSTRHRWPMRIFNRTFYSRLSAILPVSEEYAKRFSLFYPYPKQLVVTGDTRYDQIYRKAQAVKQRPEIELFKWKGSVRLITGSIWPADEKHLLPALLRIIAQNPQLQLVLVPHEISESHIAALEQTMHKANVSVERYSSFSTQGGTAAQVAIIDTIGLLAALYSTAHLAYVGGSFSSGVHNVMEPAAFGLPIIFGPRHINSHEAMVLKQLGAAFEVNNEHETEIILEKLISNEAFRNDAGQKASAMLTNSLGATQRAVAVLLPLMEN